MLCILTLPGGRVGETLQPPRCFSSSWGGRTGRSGVVQVGLLGCGMIWLGLVFLCSRHPPQNAVHSDPPGREGGGKSCNLPAALAAFGEVGRAERRRPGGVAGVRNDLARVGFSVLQAPSPECCAF
jgi:hypothetical protein